MPSNSDVYSMNSDEKIISNCFGFFPSARDVLHGAKAFANSAMPISFDQILNSRTLIVLSTKKKMFTATGQLTIT
jgi:hypothetical protein